MLHSMDNVNVIMKTLRMGLFKYNIFCSKIYARKLFHIKPCKLCTMVTSCNQNKNVKNHELKILYEKTHFKDDRFKNSTTIIHNTAANIVVENMEPDLSNNDLIMEINPGPGLLTDKLLSTVKNHILLFEPREEFYVNLCDKYKNNKQVSITNFNFLNSNSHAHFLAEQEAIYDEFLSLFPVNSKCNSSNVKIVGTIIDRKFLRRLCLNLPLNTSIYSKTYPTLYIYVPDSIILNNFAKFPYHNNNKIKFSINMEYFFISNKLATESITSFYPIMKNRKKNLQQSSKSVLHLMKVEPNWEFLTQVGQ